MLEWLKRHAWKACSRLKRLTGSNPVLSAKAETCIRAELVRAKVQVSAFATPRRRRSGMCEHREQIPEERDERSERNPGKNGMSEANEIPEGVQIVPHLELSSGLRERIFLIYCFGSALSVNTATTSTTEKNYSCASSSHKVLTLFSITSSFSTKAKLAFFYHTNTIIYQFSIHIATNSLELFNGSF